MNFGCGVICTIGCIISHLTKNNCGACEVGVAESDVQVQPGLHKTLPISILFNSKPFILMCVPHLLSSDTFFSGKFYAHLISPQGSSSPEWNHSTKWPALVENLAAHWPVAFHKAILIGYSLHSALGAVFEVTIF